MGEVLELSQRKKSVKKTNRNKDFPKSIADPNIRAAFMALCENHEILAKVSEKYLMEVFRRLDTLEAIVFAQSIMIADLRGESLTPKQKTKLSHILKRKG
jgi:hypothetical protein